MSFQKLENNISKVNWKLRCKATLLSREARICLTGYNSIQGEKTFSSTTVKCYPLWQRLTVENEYVTWLVKQQHKCPQQ